MFCPLCGNKLKFVKQDSSNSREEYKCTKYPYPCFGEDYPLYFHYPYDPDRAPGDSWSLSWIK